MYTWVRIWNLKHFLIFVDRSRQGCWFCGACCRGMAGACVMYERTCRVARHLTSLTPTSRRNLLISRPQLTPHNLNNDGVSRAAGFRPKKFITFYPQTLRWNKRRMHQIVVLKFTSVIDDVTVKWSSPLWTDSYHQDSYIIIVFSEVIDTKITWLYSASKMLGCSYVTIKWLFLRKRDVFFTRCK